MKKLLLIPLFLTITSQTSNTNPHDVNDRPSVEGALKNLHELNRWISYDYHHKIIAEEQASMYFSLVKIIITQLDSVENEKKTN